MELCLPIAEVPLWVFGRGWSKMSATFCTCSPANIPALSQISDFYQMQLHLSKFCSLGLKGSFIAIAVSACIWNSLSVLRGVLFHVPQRNHLSRTRLITPSHAEKLPAGGTCFHLCVFVRLWHEVNSCRIYQMSLCGVGCFERRSVLQSMRKMHA